MANITTGFHVIACNEDDYRILREALELHVEGLRSAKDEVTLDRTLEKAEDLVDVTRSLDEDIDRGERMLLEVFHVSR
jgi:hypothetical protein